MIKTVSCSQMKATKQIGQYSNYRSLKAQFVFKENLEVSMALSRISKISLNLR